MNFKIRKATPEDGKNINILNDKSLGYKNSENLISSNIKKLLEKKTHIILIAENEDGFLGYIHAQEYCTLYSLPFLEVVSFAVDTTIQGGGVGGSLLKAIEDWAAEQEYAGVMILCQTKRVNSIEFYKNKEYEIDKQQYNLKKYFK